MNKHKILYRLSAALLLLHSTVSYASAATPFSTYTDSTTTGSAVSGSTIASSLSPKNGNKDNTMQEELITAPVAKQALRKSSQTEGLFDNKTYTHSDVFDGMNIYKGNDLSNYNKTNYRE